MYHTNINKKYAVWVTVFLFTIILEVTKAEVIPDNGTVIRWTEKACECIVYDCGCCEHIEWDAVSLNGTLCTNATYLDHDYGFSITVTYNTVSIINETISARNPPPICFGEDVIDNLAAELCFRLYDININGTKLHICFELEARFAKIDIAPLHLGCVGNGKSVPSSENTLFLSIFAIILSHIMTNQLM